MDDLIRNIILRNWSRIADLAQTVHDVISTMWTLLTSVFTKWGSAFLYVGNQAFRFYQAAYYAVFAGANTMYWLAVVALPRTLERAAATAAVAIEARAGRLEQWIGQQLSTLEQKAAAGIDLLRQLAQQWVNDLWVQVTTLWTRFLGVEQRVAALLTHPEVMAQWLAAFIVQAVMRYAVANGSFLANLFRRNAIQLAAQLAAVIEQIIVDTLM